MTSRTGKACEKGDGDGFKKQWEEKKLKKEKKCNKCDKRTTNKER